jgi:lipopolysaccharide/colanic/teichoic acid biosynthesis glycosyltransferase
MAKRALDLVVAAIVLTVLSPLWLAIAVGIKLTSPGPVLYITESLGMGGRPFRLYKFRTMRHNADEGTHRAFVADYVKQNRPFAVTVGRDGVERRIYKVVNDPRVTPFGASLRRTGLDEIPQLLNVLRGEMSIVGPRSPRPFEYEHYEEWHKTRLAVPQGITGLYQVTARSTAAFDEMVRLDIEYIRRRNFWLDVQIMARTIPVMLFGKGGY